MDVRCNHYQQDIHQGTQPIRVLIPRVTSCFDLLTQSIQSFFSQTIELKINYGELPLKEVKLASFNPVTSVVSVSETFLSYLWCYCFCLRANLNSDMWVYDWYSSLRYARRIIDMYTPWDKEQQLNPELNLKFEQSMVNDVNTLFEFACVYVMLHEVGHAFHKHSGPSLANELEADRFAADGICGLKILSVNNTEVDRFEIAKFSGAISAISSLSLLTKYLDSSSSVHPHVDERIRVFVDSVHLPDDHFCHHVASAGILLVYGWRLQLEGINGLNIDEKEQYERALHLRSRNGGDSAKSPGSLLRSMLDGFSRERGNRSLKN